MGIRGRIRGFLCITAMLTGTLLALPSQATLITGSFSGIASGESRDWYDGTITSFAIPVTGSFSFETAIPSGEQPVVEPGSLSFRGQMFDFAVYGLDEVLDTKDRDRFGEDTVTLLQNGPEQTFRVGGGGPYWYWRMSFLDPDGGLFANFDPETFDPGQVDIGASFAEFSGDIRSYGATLDFSTLVFDGYPQSVPEPATLGLFGAGLLILAVRRRRAGRDPRP
jgi:hypothetical protein